MHGSAQLRHEQKLRRSRACLLAPAPTYWRLSFTLASTFRTTRFLTEADLPMGQVTGTSIPGTRRHPADRLFSGLLDLDLLQHGAADLVQHAHAHRARGDLRRVPAVGLDYRGLTRLERY
jgi:hypothetical protein